MDVYTFLWVPASYSGGYRPGDDMRRIALAGTLGLVLVTAAAVRFGGWALVSVDNPPEYFVAGKPIVLDFIVRQHGKDPMGGLKPDISAKSGSITIHGRAWETNTDGTYRASVTVPRPGNWKITLESGFGPSKGRLSLKAIDPAQEAPAPMNAAERGKLLFAAKGCVTCHVHRDVDLEPLMKGPPELSDKRFAVDYLSKFLADPSIKPPTPNLGQMPNLHLKHSEIAALVAFINSERAVSSR
jgi:mono/diheme cytochrome c family protein